MGNRVQNKVAIVTGAASGVGKEDAILLAREGAKVVLTDVNEEAGLAVAKQIGAGNGKATLKTAQGETLTATMEGSTIVITDAKGGKARVTIGDVYQSNGVIHVIDTVLMPS